MMTFEVRHWMTNHEADIHEFDTSVKSNTIGNIFYGSNGYLAIDGYTKYKSCIGKQTRAGTGAQRRRRPLRQLHSRPCAARSAAN